MPSLTSNLQDSSAYQRIMLIGPFPPSYGGWAHVTLSWYRALLNDGHNVAIYNTKLRRQSGPEKDRLAMLIRATRQIVNLPIVLAKRKPDIVILFTGPGGSFWRDLLLIQSCVSRKIPVFVRAFGGVLFTHIAQMPALERSFAIRILRKAKALLVETEDMVRQWQDIAPSTPAYRVPNFIHEEDIEIEKAFSDHFQAVYVGSLTPLKGVEVILESVDRICNELPFTVHFIGGEITAGYLEQFYALVSKLQHSDAVRVHGALPHAEALKVAGQCQAFLFPTQWPGEGQPAALIEAMAMGLVPIATSWRGVAEIIKHEVNGLLLSTPDSGQLVEAILRLIEDRGLYAELAENARSTIMESYEAKKAVDQFYQILADASISLYKGVQ